jgi:hypothetical protein
MAFDQDSFVAEVNAAIDQSQAEAASAEGDAAETQDNGGDGSDSKVDGGEAGESQETVEGSGGQEAGEDASESTDGGAGDTGTETKTETVGTESGTSTVTPPAISDDALTEAVRAGIPLAEAREYPSEAALTRAVGIIRQATEKSGQSAGGKESKSEDDPLASLPKLDPANYEPEVIEMFDKLTGVIRQQQEAIRSFREHQESTARSSQESAAREVEHWFDEQVSKLGDDFAEALGKGGYASLNRGSAQFASRDKIAAQMSVLLAGYQAAGQSAPSREEVFDMAARHVLRDVYQKVSEKKLASDLAKRSTQHIQRAGGQNNKSKLSPQDETAALLDEKFPSR